MIKKSLYALAVAATTMLAACGGGGSSGDPAPAPTPPEAKVEGPLDAVQDPLSSQVFAALAAALAGTPLEAVVNSADDIVVRDVLDIVDALALALQEAAQTQNPAALAGAADDIQASVTQLAADLQILLNHLAASSGGTPGAANPLAGTPLEPLGAALSPVLAQITGGLGGSNPPDLNLTQLAQVVSVLNQQLQSGLAQVPAEARNAPVVGGVFSTLSVALNDVSDTLDMAGAYNGQGTAAALETTLNHTLVNVLTQVVPVAFIEQQAGQPGVLSGQIEAAAAQVSAALGDNLGTVLTPALETVLGSALAPLLDPVENQVLPMILTPVIDALSGGGSGGSGPTGTPLDAVLVTVTEALDGLLGGAVPCLFAGTPLAMLCTLLP